MREGGEENVNHLSLLLVEGVSPLSIVDLEAYRKGRSCMCVCRRTVPVLLEVFCWAVFFPLSHGDQL